MNFLPDTNLIFDSLGWAVLHSFWQGAIAGVLVWAFRAITRENAADTRYMFGLLTLCALLTTFIGTFLYYYNTGAVSLPISSGAAVETITVTQTAAPMQSAPTNPLMRLTDYTNWVGILWAVCFVVLSMRYLAAFQLTHKLRTTGLTDLPSNWQGKFNALAQRSGVTGKVRGFISEHVSSPITFGFFKPIVLVPAWFFTGMNAEQCEAVLLHEFAHIRRHDYLTNILQIIIKTVFFYHPAVQFICKSVNIDREHACDDFAVLVTNNPEMLAKALGTVRIKAARDGGVFALSADGPEAPLMHRLKRLMGTQSKSVRTGSTRGTAAAIMLTTACAFIFALGSSDSSAHPQTQIEELAGGKNTPHLKTAWSDSFGKTLSVNGKIYVPTKFSFQDNGNGTDTINGRKYPSQYYYSVYARNGESHVVREKAGKLYMEIGDRWHAVDASRRKQKKASANKTQYIVVNGETYTLGASNQDSSSGISIIGDSNEKLYYLIDGKKYSSNYSYELFNKDGETFVVKEKKGKRYIEIDGNWHKVKHSHSVRADRSHEDADKFVSWISGGKSFTNSHGNTFTVTGKTNVVSNNGRTALVGDNTYVKNGQTYINGIPSKSRYSYSLITLDGQRYQTRTDIAKNQTDIKVNSQWFDIDETDLDKLIPALNAGYLPQTPQTPITPPNGKYTYGRYKVNGEAYKTKTNVDINQTFIKVRGKWYDMDKADLDALLPTPPLSPTPPYANNYWISGEERRAVEDRVERAAERREEAFERAEEQREYARELAEEQREYAREFAEEQREEAVEKQAERRERVIEQKIRTLEKKIARKEREMAKEESRRSHEISKLEVKIAKTQNELTRNASSLSRGELGALQGEIGRLQGEIGRLHGANGHDQGEIGRMAGEIGRMQGEIGRIQGEWGQRKSAADQAKYYALRDRLIPQLKADGYMKTDKSKVTIKYTPKDIFINGKQLASSQTSKYCDIVSDYMDKKNSTKKIVIKPGYLHVSQKGNGKTHSFTYNE